MALNGHWGINPGLSDPVHVLIHMMKNPLVVWNGRILMGMGVRSKCVYQTRMDSGKYMHRILV
jgi:hypothetical protein